MESPNQPPEPPRWDRGDDAVKRNSERGATPGQAKPAAPVKSDQSMAGEEDPGSALDSLDEANGQPETKKPSKG